MQHQQWYRMIEVSSYTLRSLQSHAEERTLCPAFIDALCMQGAAAGSTTRQQHMYAALGTRDFHKLCITVRPSEPREVVNFTKYAIALTQVYP